MKNRTVQIDQVNRKLESAKSLKLVMKIAAFVFLFIFTIFALMQNEMISQLWPASPLMICVLFCIDLYYSFQKRKLEMEIYTLKIKEKEAKIKLAEVKKEYLDRSEANKYIKKPSDKVGLPIALYVGYLIADVLVRIFLIH
ncbi:MAG: hypothetical protein KBS85_06400 [Lachnospiraceae bacterium]|nr:hypothetical protein [Candidatus Merdinaster equi]